ncbi:MAG: aspartate aminotransferase family protein, partial [Bacteroidota bacterium]
VYSPVRARAAELLHNLLPDEVGRIFFCNSGTEANETALKLARTWTGKTGAIAMIGGFHGRTLGSLSATGIAAYRDPYASVLPPVDFVPFGDAGALERVLEENSDVAAVILEPIQSMAGVFTAGPEYFEQVRSLCDRAGCALIFDEVQTGVGRTGSFTFASACGVMPDMITMVKSLGSGIPVGAVATSDSIARSVKTGDQGTTFGGGMVAMAAMAATLAELVEGRWMERATELFSRISRTLSPHVVEVRGMGCLIGVELSAPAGPFLKTLRDNGVLAGSSGHPNTIRLMPPLNTPDAVVDHVMTTFVDALSSLAAETHV